MIEVRFFKKNHDDWINSGRKKIGCVLVLVHFLACIVIHLVGRSLLIKHFRDPSSRDPLNKGEAAF